MKHGNLKDLKYSEVLWIAANEVLTPDAPVNHVCGCCIRAIGEFTGDDFWTNLTPRMNYWRKMRKWLDSFEGNPGGYAHPNNNFNSFRNNGYEGKASQGARYLYMDFVRLVAEDEGK